MKLLKLTVSALALLPTAAFAQDGEIVIADTRYEPRDLVVTASGFEQERRNTGQAISVISKEDLDRTQTAVLSDILRTVPSVRIARNGGLGGVTSAFIRGGESSQTLVLIDGVRINDPSSPNAAFDFGALLTGNIDRVEVLRGPNSVIWGSQAIGGVVNIRTEAPTDAFSVTARGEYGYRDTANASANVAGSSGIVSGSVGASYAHTDGISALAAGTERDGYRNFAANGKLKIAFSDTLSLDLRGYYNRGRAQFDDPFAPTPEINFPETKNEQFVAYAGLNANFAEGHFRNRLAYTRTDIRRTGTEQPADPFSFNVNDFRGTIDRFEYHGSFDVVDALTLVFGLEHENAFASTFFPANGTPDPDTARYKVTSVFGQAIVRPFQGLTVTGGVRHDDYNLYGGETTFGANFAFTPNGGSTVLRGTYAEGFRAPTLTESTLPFGNPDVKPETAKSYDIGIEHRFLNRAVTASATWFHRRSNNQIAFSFVTFQSENIARVRAQGLELELRIEPTANLQFAAGYNFFDAESRSNDGTFGNQLARRPKQSANASIDWTSPWGLKLGASVLVTGDAFDSLSNLPATRLDGYELVDIRAAFPIGEHLELFGRVENLFDQRYQSVLSYGTYGRSAYAGVRVKF